MEYEMFLHYISMFGISISEDAKKLPMEQYRMLQWDIQVEGVKLKDTKVLSRAGAVCWR